MSKLTKSLKGKELEKFLKERFPNWKQYKENN